MKQIFCGTFWTDFKSIGILCLQCLSLGSSPVSIIYLFLVITEKDFSKEKKKSIQKHFKEYLVLKILQNKYDQSQINNIHYSTCKIAIQNDTNKFILDLIMNAILCLFLQKANHNLFSESFPLCILFLQKAFEQIEANNKAGLLGWNKSIKWALKSTLSC